MDRQEIIETAIRKALDGGWKHTGFGLMRQVRGLTYDDGDWARFFRENKHLAVIFNHDFAKALWGKNGHHTRDVFVSTVCVNCHQEGAGTYADEDWAEPCYQHHLQRMVIADDPIKYLEQNI